ncbi:MAG: Acinetobacter phage phiAC [Acidobacteriota bacterium]|jgi:hypothetical protein
MAVGDYNVQPFTLPVGADSVSWQARSNDNLLRGKFVDHQADAVAHPTYGLDANKPSPAQTGMIYVATDTGVFWFYNGTTWVSTAAFRQFGGWQDTTNQTAAAANTGYAMTFNTADVTDGVTLVSNSRITVPMTGIYNLQFSAQLVNTDSSIHDVDIWLKKNGTNISGTNGRVSVPNRHGSVDGAILPAWNYFLNLNANDYVELFWSTTNTAVSLQAIAASAPHPAAASVIVTINRI